MNKEKKQEYTLRIAQANKTELIVILYEMTLTYLNDALIKLDVSDIDGFGDELMRARACIDELIGNLHFEYEPARQLKQLYLYMKKCIRESLISGKNEGLDDVIKHLDRLRESYESVKDTDTSGPVMSHTQTVLAGMTYSKDKVLNSLTQECPGRGFLA